jgi:hypothetical protein
MDFVLDKNHDSVDFTMGGYTLHVTLDELFGAPCRERLWAHHGHRAG